MSAQPTVGTAPVDREPSRRRGPAWGPARAAATAFGALLCLAALAVYLVAPWEDSTKPQVKAQQPVAVAWGRPVVSASGLAQRSGAAITQVAVTGAGGLVDLRFEVVDPEAAATIHDPSTPPAVVDERSGLVVHELFMGHAHTGVFKAGVTYYFVFINSRNWIHSGSRVTVLLGDAAVEHVVVQ